MVLKPFRKFICYQIGIRPVLIGSDKSRYNISRTENHQKIITQENLDFFNDSSGITENSFTCYECLFWWFDIIRTANLPSITELDIVQYSGEIIKVFYCVCLLVWIIWLGPTISYRRRIDSCVVVRVQVQFTVKSLHVGTLVTYWTTAPSLTFLRNQNAQLAPLLLLFLTLTIAARCNAFTNTTYLPIDQLRSLSNFSPIRNSKTNFPNLLLGRIIQTHFPQKRNLTSRVSPYVARRSRRYLGSYNHISENSILKTRDSDWPLVKKVNLDKTFNKINLDGRKTEYSADRQSGENLSDIVSVAGNFSRVISQKLNYTNIEFDSPVRRVFQQKTGRPMPPVHSHSDNSSVDKWNVLSIIVSSIALTVTLGVITCILSHYRAGAAPEGGGTASNPNNAALTPTSAPMLSVVSAGATAGVGGMERLRGGRAAARDIAAARERQVRLHALRTDLAVNLPPSITMPDGEDHPYSNPRLHIRDAEQEAEIYQKCIRPPPNRTVLESESPPPYRSSSAGLLGSSSSSSSSADWSTSGSAGNAPLVVRCHSMSSTTKRPEAGASGQKTDFLQRTVNKIFTGKKTTPQAPSPAPTLPAVVVPSSSRRRPPDQNPPTTHRPSKGSV